MADTQDAQPALVLAYEQTIGRDLTAAERALNQQQIADGTSGATLRTYLSSTGYAAGALARLYTDVVGRAVTAPELAADQAYLPRAAAWRPCAASSQTVTRPRASSRRSTRTWPAGRSPWAS